MMIVCCMDGPLAGTLADPEDVGGAFAIFPFVEHCGACLHYGAHEYERGPDEQLRWVRSYTMLNLPELWDGQLLWPEGMQFS